MIDSHSVFLLVSAVASVIGLILLITLVKAESLDRRASQLSGAGGVTGMPLSTVVHSFEAGVGGTLGHIAMIVALGTMLGKMMAESGAANQIAYNLIRLSARSSSTGPWWRSRSGGPACVF